MGQWFTAMRPIDWIVRKPLGDGRLVGLGTVAARCRDEAESEAQRLYGGELEVQARVSDEADGGRTETLLKPFVDRDRYWATRDPDS